MALQVEVSGVGPPVLLLHGVPHPASDFRPIVERLRDSHRVIVPHLPGFAGSPRLVPHSFAAVSDAIVAEVLARGARELSILGYSIGGLYALALALDARLDVRSVIVLAGLARYGDAERETMRGFLTMLRAGPDLRDASWRAIAAQRFTVRPELADAVGDWLHATTPDVIADELESALAEDLRPRLPHIAAPVFLRVGALDVATPPSYAREIASLCRHATLEIVPGLGHALCLEDPAGTAEFVARALA